MILNQSADSAPDGKKESLRYRRMDGETGAAEAKENTAERVPTFHFQHGEEHSDYPKEFLLKQRGGGRGVGGQLHR